MKQGVLEKKALSDVIESLLKDFTVYGPVKGDLISLQELSSGGDIALDFSNFKVSLKNLLTPRSEIVCTYEDGVANEVWLSEGKALVFGTRPCDARSLLVLDKVFTQDSEDPSYVTRRNDTTIVSLACNAPAGTCFCASIGGSPFGREGSDILACELNRVFLLEAVTEDGERLMQNHAKLFHPATEAHLKEKDAMATKAESMLSTVDLENIGKSLEGLFDSTFWDEFHQRCLGCGAWTYLCPTCHCFGFYDERSDPKGERIRYWDSCQYAAFTLEASGHNPRVSSRERMRQRIMHKFSYFMKIFDEPACVGCGRCVDNCPVNLDLREIVTEVREASS